MDGSPLVVLSKAPANSIGRAVYGPLRGVLTTDKGSFGLSILFILLGSDLKYKRDRHPTSLSNELFHRGGVASNSTTPFTSN